MENKKLTNQPKGKTMKKIIVRSEAGVFVGMADKKTYLKELEKNYIILTDSMNINRYEGAASLHQLATGTYTMIRLSPLVKSIIIKGTYFEILEVEKSAQLFSATTNWKK